MKLSKEPVRAWDSMVSTAVLGLDRTGIAAAAKSGVNAQENFLKEMAILSLYRKAGLESPPAAKPSWGPYEGHETTCTTRAAASLREILTGEYRGLWAEWSQAAISNSVKAPAELLPDLLDRARTMSFEQRQALRDLIGDRGIWLADKNPAWRGIFLAAEPDEAVWHAGTRDQRLQCLHALRNQDAAKARSLLEATWQEESPDDRTIFIEALAIGLCPQDEPFLEQCLGDKRKPVRIAAADLLSRLPASALCGRMAHRLFKLISFAPARKGILRTAKASVGAELPDIEDKSLLRDGIETQKVSTLGPKAVALASMVGYTRLEEWKRLGAAGDEILAAALSSEFGTSFAIGFARAAIRQRNTEWIRSISSSFMAWHDKMVQAGTFYISPQNLMDCLDPVDREKMVSQYMRNNSGDKNATMILELLMACDHRWSRDFSSMAFDAIQRHYLKHMTDYSLRKPIVEQFAMRISPDLAQRVTEGWPVNSDKFRPGDREMVARLAAILQFRQQMLRELDSGNKITG